jgi:hypothetical protein
MKYLTLVMSKCWYLKQLYNKNVYSNTNCPKIFCLIVYINQTVYVYIAWVICKWTTNLWIMLLINKRDQLCSVKFW